MRVGCWLLLSGILAGCEGERMQESGGDTAKEDSAAPAPFDVDGHLAEVAGRDGEGGKLANPVAFDLEDHLAEAREQLVAKTKMHREE